MTTRAFTAAPDRSKVGPSVAICKWAPGGCHHIASPIVANRARTSGSRPREDAGYCGTVSALLRAIQAVHVATLRPAWRRFERAAAAPEAAQAERLARLVRANADTAYGRAHRLAAVRTVRDLQDRLPIVDYDALEPWIERVAAGEAAALTAEPVRTIERSGGSTATNKLVPYTTGLLAEFSAATGAWLYDLARARPALAGTRSYWSVSPVARGREHTSGGLPIGFEDDTEYFGRLERWALRRMMAVPASVARLPDMETWRRATLARLLACADLGFVSVWSPSFLVLLMDALTADLDALLRDLPPARARAIERALASAGELTGEAIWPRLDVISCWGDGAAAQALGGLRRYFPRTEIQPKGLLATEGVVSFPLWGHDGAALAVTSHLLEFIDLDRPEARPLEVHELRAGGSYSPLLTTGGGLYRYHLKDVVRCVGRFRELPLVRFVGKLDRVSDLCGEKVSGGQVEQALAEARAATGLEPSFALVAPIEARPPRYALFVECEGDDDALGRMAAFVEGFLATGHHYRYCRDLGQLGPLVVHRVTRGWETYQRTLVAQGQRMGDIKPAHLDTRPIWAEAFGLGDEREEPDLPTSRPDGRVI